MNNTKLCLCFVLLVLNVSFLECRGGRGGGGRGGGSRGGGSRGGGGHGGGRHGGGGHGGGGGGWSFFGWGSKPSNPTYPKSPGYSGHGTGGTHGYPKSPGYSGHGTGGTHTYPHSPGYSGSGNGFWSSGQYTPSRPTYYTSPQYVYVKQYREVQSPYSDLLTGLTLYNMGRSHHYHHHYYHDDYQRSSSSGVAYSPVHNQGTGSDSQGTKDEAKCVLKIRKDGKEDVIKIPCAIVSTFDSGNHTSNEVVNNNTSTSNNCSSLVNKALEVNSTFTNNNNLNDGSLRNNTLSDNVASNPCVNVSVDINDPLSVTGAPIVSDEAKNMECSVEIRTKEEVIRNNVDCNTLLKYAKMSVPEDKTGYVLPPREKLKSMLNKPPWWLSFFIAV